jgi:hypothetical protein
VIHQDAAHDPSRHGEEVGTVLPRHVLGIHQPEVRLVDEHGGLEAVVRALSCHAALRDLVKLVVDDWNQSLEGALVASPPLEKEPGDFRGILRNGAILVFFSPG